jgi:molybdate transport system regulatory protein
MVTPFRPGLSQVKGLFQSDLMSEKMSRLHAKHLRNGAGSKMEKARQCLTGLRASGRKPPMKYGARNKITAKVTSIKSDQIMSLVKFDVTAPAQMASVLTTESVQELGLKTGDTVQLVIKAIHVLPVRE